MHVKPYKKLLSSFAQIKSERRKFYDCHIHTEKWYFMAEKNYRSLKFIIKPFTAAFGKS